MNTKKKPAKKRHHEVTAYDSKGYIVPTKATVAVPRPKKRTAGVEVVKVKVSPQSISDIKRGGRGVVLSPSDTGSQPIYYSATLHIPKRRSSK